MSENKSTLSRIVTWAILGILAVIAFRLALRLFGFVAGLFGFVFGSLMFLLFTVGPVLLLGWLAVKAWKAFTRPTRLTTD